MGSLMAFLSKLFQHFLILFAKCLTLCSSACQTWPLISSAGLKGLPLQCTSWHGVQLCDYSSRASYVVPSAIWLWSCFGLPALWVCSAFSVIRQNLILVLLLSAWSLGDLVFAAPVFCRQSCSWNVLANQPKRFMSFHWPAGFCRGGCCLGNSQSLQ